MRLHEREEIHGHRASRRGRLQRGEERRANWEVILERVRCRIAFAVVGEQREIGVRMPIAVGKRDIFTVHLNTIRPLQFTPLREFY